MIELKQVRSEAGASQTIKEKEEQEQVELLLADGADDARDAPHEAPIPLVLDVDEQQREELPTVEFPAVSGAPADVVHVLAAAGALGRFGVASGGGAAADATPTSLLPSSGLPTKSLPTELPAAVKRRDPALDLAAAGAHLVGSTARHADATTPLEGNGNGSVTSSGSGSGRALLGAEEAKAGPGPPAAVRPREEL